MATPASHPTTFGTARIEAGELVLRRSPGGFLRSQISLLRDGGLAERVWSAWGILGLALAPIVLFQNLRLVLGSDTWFVRLQAAVVAVAVTLVIGYMVGHTTRIPLDRLEAGVVTSGRRSLHLPATARGRWWRALTLGVDPVVTFVHGADRDAVADALEDRDVPVERRFTATAATYRFFRSGGGYFCPTCDERVAPTSAACPGCGRSLGSSGSPSARSGDDPVGRGA